MLLSIQFAPKTLAGPSGKRISTLGLSRYTLEALKNPKPLQHYCNFYVPHPGLELPGEAGRGARAERSPHNHHSVCGPPHDLRQVQEGHPYCSVDAV